MTYQQKSAWINLLILLLMFGGYLAYAIFQGGPIHLGGPLLLLITIQIVGNAILGATSRQRLVDERDRIIAARGRQVGYIVLLVFIWMTFGYLANTAVVSSLVIANLLILAIVVAELSGLVARIILYRATL